MCGQTVGECADAFGTGSDTASGGCDAVVTDDPDADDDAAERLSQWRDSERHVHGKSTVVAAYRGGGMAAHPELVSESATLQKDWIAAAFHPLLDAVRAYDDKTGVEKSTPPPAERVRAEGVRGTHVRRAAEQAAAAALTELAPGTGVYTFDLFTKTFREALLREVEAFERTDLPRRRPNTMNAAGLIVNEIGMHDLMSDLLHAVVAPLVEVLYASELFATSLDHHHSFIVHYAHQAGCGR